MSKVSSLSVSGIAQTIIGFVLALLGLYVAYSAQNAVLKVTNPFNYTMIGAVVFIVGSLLVVTRSE